MKTRDYRDFSRAMADDFMVYVRNHPDAFEALLFKPDQDSPEKTAVNTDVVGALEAEERALEYQDPAIVKVVQIPDEFPFGSVDAGGEPDGNADQPVVLLIGDPSVPKQSIVQYREFINDTDLRAVSLYVMRSEIIGEAPGACEKHYCVPFQAFDFEYIEAPVAESPADEAADIGETPTLAAGEFVVHGTDDTHTKSQWQVRTDAGAYDDPVHDSEACTDLRTHTLPAGILAPGSDYFWRVRYRGAAGDLEGETEVWSDWSEETRFTTMEAF